jgi:hypothetical protein
MTKQTLNESRIAAIIEALGEPDQVFADQREPGKQPIDIYAFARNFVEDCDDDAPEREDNGFVLVTSGMSDRLMHGPAGGDTNASLAAELLWYVREPSLELIAHLRWLARLPEIDTTWLGHGHTIPLPSPPLNNAPFKVTLLLSPIIVTDSELFGELETATHTIETLVVHLVSDAEYAQIKSRDEGLNEFLDLLDERNYPLVFDPARPSYH